MAIHFDPTNVKTAAEARARDLGLKVRADVMAHLEPLKAHDNDSVDLNSRPGTVVVPKHRVGLHMSSGSVEFSPQTGEITKGEANETHVVRSERHWSLSHDEQGHKVYSKSSGGCDGNLPDSDKCLTELGPHEWIVADRGYAL